MKKNSIKKLFVAILVITILAASIGAASAHTYNRQKAVNFATSNYNNLKLPGSWYFYFKGGDCTNFASQCVHAGGWEETPSWYYNNLFDYSNSWTVVQSFGDFAINSGRATEYVFKKGAYTLPSSVPIKSGDIIQMNWDNDNTWDHSAIVTNLACSVNPPYDTLVWVTQHSDNLKNHPLSKVKQNNPQVRFRVLLLKNSY